MYVNSHFCIILECLGIYNSLPFYTAVIFKDSDFVLQHDISGKALIHMNDESLIRLGINDTAHRDAIWREILKLKLKADIQELKEIEMSFKYPEQPFFSNYK